MSPFPATDPFLCESNHLFWCRRHPLVLVGRPAAEPAELIIPLDESVQTVAAPFVCVNSLRPSLLMTFEFSLPNPPPPLFFSSSPDCNPPPRTTSSEGSWELRGTNFRLYQWLGLTTPQHSTPQIDEPSDADLLYMAATLEPPHIWSGVCLLKNWGQPWPKQV